MNGKSENFKYGLMLFVTIAIGAFLRLQALDEVSLRWDEIIAINASHLSVSQLFVWSAYHEVHPPLFHFILKMAGLFVHDPEMYRLIPACFGILGICLSYKTLAECFTPRVGLWGSFIWSVFPFAIMLSRVVRPYTIAIDLLFVCQMLLIKYCKTGRVRYLYFLCAANGFLVLFQYIGFFVIASQFVCLALFAESRAVRQIKSLFFYVVLNGLSCSASMYFLVHTLFYGDQPLHKMGFSVFAQTFVKNLSGVVSYDQVLAVLFGVMVVGGMIVAFARLRMIFYILLSGIIIPSIIIIIIRLGPYFNPWHLFYMLPAAITFCSLFLDAVTNKFGVKALAVLVVAISVLTGLPARYAGALFGPDASLLANNYDINYKEFSSSFSEILRENNYIILVDSMTKYGLGKYLPSQCQGARKRYNNLGPNDTDLLIASVGPKDNIPKAIKEKIDGTETVPVEQFQGLDLVRAEIKRTPQVLMNSIPFSRSFFQDIGPTLRSVYSLRNVSIGFENSFLFSPADAEKTGEVEFDFLNTGNAFVSQIMLCLDYINMMDSSIVSIQYAFDDAPYETLFISKGVDRESRAQVPIYPNKIIRHFKLRITMQPGLFPLGYYGPRLDLVGLRALDVSVCGDDQESCISSFVDKMPSGFDGLGLATQRIVSMENIKIQNEDRMVVLTPEDPVKPGIINVAVQYKSGILHFFPRACGNDSSVLAKYGGQTVAEFTGAGNKWSPVGGKYFLRNIPYNEAEQIVQFELDGKGAQLWGGNGNLLGN